MKEASRKDACLSLIQAERTKLERILATLSDEQMLQPGVAGDWSTKDVMAHLTWWEQDLIKTLRSEERKAYTLRGNLETIDHANALIIESSREVPLKENQAEFQRSYEELLQVIATLKEEELADEKFYTYLIDHTALHYTEHSQWIEEAFHQPKHSYAALLLAESKG